LQDENVVDGETLEYFSPNRRINRAEVLKMILLTKKEPISPGRQEYFPDVKAGQWFSSYVNTSKERNIIDGYPDGLFHPEKNINKAEFIKIINNVFSLEKNLPFNFLDVEGHNWFNQYIGVVSKYNLFPLSGYLTLNPSKELTRGEVAIALYQITKYQENASTNQGFLIERIDIVGDKINSSVGESRVPALTFNLSAKRNIQVDRIRFRANTRGQFQNFVKAWVETERGKISDDVTIDSDIFIVNFFNPIILNKGGKVKVSLYVSVDPRADTNNRIGNTFSILNNAWIYTSPLANFQGKFPIQGYKIFISEKPSSFNRQSSNSSRQSSRTYRTTTYITNTPATPAVSEFASDSSTANTSAAGNSSSSNPPSFLPFISVEKEINGPLKKSISRGDIGTFFTFKFKSDVSGSVKSVRFGRSGNGTYLDFDQLWLESNGVIMSNKIEPNNDQFRIDFIKPIRIDPGVEVALNLMGRISESANIEGTSRFIIYRKDWIEIALPQDVVGGFPLSGYTIRTKE
jgi:hypothetical protein